MSKYEHLHPEKLHHLHDAVCLCCLGRGGYGCVKLYQCKEHSADCCESCNQYFVVKRIRTSMLHKREKQFQKMLRNEYTIGINIDHPNIIKTFDIDLIDNSLILEYCGGVDLYTYIVYNRDYNPLETYSTYFHQLVCAVEYLHNRGIAHLDIKPENILVNRETGVLKLIDFGEAEVFGHTNGMVVKRKGIRGSTPYLPPEVFDDISYDCDKVDVWSCGIVLYAIIFKTMPWFITKDSDYNYCRYQRTKQLPGVLTCHFADESQRQIIMGNLLMMLEPDVSKRTLNNKAFKNIEEYSTPKAIEDGHCKVPLE